jgi:hypothetical protein
MLRFAFFFLLISGQYLTATSSSQEDDNHDQSLTPVEMQQRMAFEELMLMDEGDVLNSGGDDARRLQLSAVPCSGGGPISPFTLSIQFVPQPSVDLTKCTTTMKTNIATSLNALLLDYGIGASGVGDGAAYVATVCPKPTTLLKRRRLAILGFVWKGGGICKSCPPDNGDGRRLGRALQTSDPNWFKNIYVPELQNILRNAITSKVVTKYPICFGGGPQVLVVVTEVTSTSMIPTCV